MQTSQAKAIEDELTPLIDRTLVDIRAIFPDATEQQLTKLGGPLLRLVLGVSDLSGRCLIEGIKGGIAE